MHDELPTRPGHWQQSLELSYADVASLRGVGGLGVPWLYCDNGLRVLSWDTHCNSLHTRWILRNHGIRLAGPPVTDLVDEVPPDALRDEARAALRDLYESTRAWAPMHVAWTQRYIVATYCRIFYTVRTAEVTSKGGALDWASEHLDAHWRPLLNQVRQDRARGWDPDEPPRPGSLDQARAFGKYVEALAS